VTAEDFFALDLHDEKTELVNGELLRLRDWFAAGVRAVWMLYPGTASVHAYRSPSEVRIFQRGEVLTGGDDLLPGFSCAVSDLFR